MQDVLGNSAVTTLPPHALSWLLSKGISLLTAPSTSCLIDWVWNVVKTHNARSSANHATTPKMSLQTINATAVPSLTVFLKCSTSNIVYEATVSSKKQFMRNCIGMTEHRFKTRYGDHKQSFEKKKYATKNRCQSTFGSWRISNKVFNQVVNYATNSAYHGSSKQCNLCQAEKLLS